MSFKEYVGVEAIFLAIILGFLAFFMGRNSLRTLEAEKQRKAFEQLFAMARPSDRLPSRRERRIMKRERSRIQSAKQDLQALGHKSLILCVVYAGVFSWFCLAVYAAVAYYAAMITLLVGLVNFLIFTTVAHEWNKWTVGAALVMLVMIIPSAYLSKIDTSVQKEKTEQHVISEMSDTLVGEILYDRNDTLYKKYLPEIEKYTDEFGVDLDRLLEDYDYDFLIYDIGVREPPQYGTTWQKPDSGDYWIVFTRGDSDFEKNIAVHSFGGWLKCIDGDAVYSMMPLTYEEPDIVVSLHEASYKVNRDVLALLMEFLARQEKTPRLTVEEPQNI